MRLEVSARSVLRTLLMIIGLLLVANIAGLILTYRHGYPYETGVVRIFNFDWERNVPSLFASVQIGTASLLLTIIGAIRKTRGESYLSWFILAFIFLYLAADEAIGIHERFTYPLQERFGLSGIFYFGWVVPYGIATLIFGLCFARFVVSLPARIRNIMILSGFVFLTGALGFEMLSGFHMADVGHRTIYYSVLATCEELLEFLGIALFIYALLLFIANHYATVEIQVRE